MNPTVAVVGPGSSPRSCGSPAGPAPDFTSVAWRKLLHNAAAGLMVLTGRPLERDTRNGVVQRRGRAHGIPTPISDLVVPLLAAAGAGPG